MSVNHAGLPLAWDDAATPAFAQAGGAAAPNLTDFVGTGTDAIRLHTFVASTEDRVHNTCQIMHDLYIPNSGNIVFKPHVHFTFVTEPTTGNTVVWEWTYVYAKPGITAASAGQFQNAVLTATGTYTCTADVEIRKHLILALGDVTIAAADCAPSMVFAGTLKLKSTSTVTADYVGLLSFDIHYQKGPIGTDSEYV